MRQLLFISDKYIVTSSGQRKLQKLTAGHNLQIQWKDKSESWAHLKDLKEPHPIEVVGYLRVCGIADELAFVWWTPYTIRKQNIILSAVKTRIKKITYKYGIEIPTNLACAYDINAQNDNNIW
eukprot:6798232-Ditylum_brightwellii.AAC.1